MKQLEDEYEPLLSDCAVRSWARTRVRRLGEEAFPGIGRLDR